MLGGIVGLTADVLFVLTGVNWRATYEDLARLSEGRHFSGFNGVPLNKLLDISMGTAVRQLGLLQELMATTARLIVHRCGICFFWHAVTCGWGDQQGRCVA